jgi:hypothetical protein
VIIGLAWQRILRLCNPVPCSRTPSAFPAERPLGLKGDCGYASPRYRTSLVSKSSATFVKPDAAPLSDGAFVRSNLAEPSATRHAAIGVFDAIAKSVRFACRDALLCLRHRRKEHELFCAMPCRPGCCVLQGNRGDAKRSPSKTTLGNAFPMRNHASTSRYGRT